MESCFDDLSTSLIVTRMLSDSVAKGIANAMVKEAHQGVDSKEVEIEELKKMFFSEMHGGQGCYDCGQVLSEVSKFKMEWLDGTIHSDDPRLVLKGQLQMLKDEIEYFRNMMIGNDKTYSGNLNHYTVHKNFTQISSRADALGLILDALCRQGPCRHKELLVEQQWRWDLEKEIEHIAVACYIKDIREDFSMKLCGEGFFCKNRRKVWSNKIKELSILRKELYAISASIFGSDQENLEAFDELKSSGKKKIFSQNVLARRFPVCSENGDATLDRTKEPTKEVDMDLLTHLSKEEYRLKKELTKEELITYYLTEMSKMSRKHESALHEKTEELFRIKRELLRQRDSSPFLKDKEFQNVRYKIQEFISSLDGILGIEDNNDILIVQEDQYFISSLKDQINVLIAENEHLKILLSRERKEVKRLSSSLSDAVMQMSYHTSTEIKLLEGTRKLKQTLEEAKIQMLLQDETINIVFMDWISSIRNAFENFQIDLYVNHCIDLTVLTEAMTEAIYSAKSILQRHEKEERHLRKEISEKEEALGLEVEKTANLKDKLESLSRLMQENEKIAEVSATMLVLEREKHELIFQELNLLQKQYKEQETRLLHGEQKVGKLTDKLRDTSVQVCQYAIELQMIDEKLKVAQADLKESEKQRMILEKTIHQEKQKSLTTVEESNLLKDKMKAFMLHAVGLSRSFEDFESTMLQRVQKNESRIEELKLKFNPVTPTVHSLRRELSAYRCNMEIKLSNLQKAEDEVDLLGDEVDALLSVLAKVYITVDHYSHVLQHYPGVMEILKLVRAELERSAKSYK